MVALVVVVVVAVVVNRVFYRGRKCGRSLRVSICADSGGCGCQISCVRFECEQIAMEIFRKWYPNCESRPKLNEGWSRVKLCNKYTLETLTNKIQNTFEKMRQG